MYVSIHDVVVTIECFGYWNAYYDLRNSWGRSRWDSVWLLWIAHNRMQFQRKVNYI